MGPFCLYVWYDMGLFLIFPTVLRVLRSDHIVVVYSFGNVGNHVQAL